MAEAETVLGWTRAVFPHECVKFGSFCISRKKNSRTEELEPRKRAQWLRILAALGEDPGSVPSIPMGLTTTWNHL